MNHKKYRPEIDGLRAVAVLIVIIFHAFPKLLPGGFVGVDVFFVISGFLITGILQNEIEENHFSFELFYARRFRRLLPASLFVVVVVLVVGWYSLNPYELKFLGKHIFGASAFITNILLWREQGYFDSASELKPLLHFWSLAVEEQFYLLWPALLLLIHRWKFPVVKVIACILLLSFFSGVYASSYAPEFGYFSVITRLWQLGIGAILVFIPAWAPGKMKSLSGAICLGLILVPAFFLGSTPYTTLQALMPTLGTAGLIYWGSHLGFLGKILEDRRVRYLGALSYPLYLWHWPILSFMRIMEGPFLSTTLINLGLLLSLVLSVLTYHLIEKPAQSRMNFQNPKVSKRKVIMASMVVLGLIGLAGLAIFKKDGFPNRSTARKLSVITFSNPLTELQQNTKESDCPLQATGPLSWWDTGVCMKKAGTDPKVAVWGDSLSFAVQSGLLHAEVDSIIFGQAGCPPIIGQAMVDKAGRKKCAVENERILEYILESKTIKGVVLVSAGAPYVTLVHGNKPFDFFFQDSSFAERGEHFKQGLLGVIEKLSKARKKIFLYFPHPSTPQFIDPAYCTPARPVLSRNSGCEADKKEYEEWQRSYRTMLTDLEKQFPLLKVIYVGNLFCREEKCSTLKDGESLYLDATHLSEVGAVLIGRELKSEMASLLNN